MRFNDYIMNELKIACSHYPIKYLGIFGSYARGEQKPGSDLDLIVEFNDKISLLDLVHIQNDLKDKLHIEIDLHTRKSISKYMIHDIEHEVVTVYEEQ